MIYPKPKLLSHKALISFLDQYNPNLHNRPKSSLKNVQGVVCVNCSSIFIRRKKKGKARNMALRRLDCKTCSKECSQQYNSTLRESTDKLRIRNYQREYRNYQRRLRLYG